MEQVADYEPEDMSRAEIQVFRIVAFCLPFSYGYSPTGNYMVWHKGTRIPVSGRDYPSLKEAVETDTVNRLVPNFIYRLNPEAPASSN